MNSTYNEEYYKNYDVGIEKVDYEGSRYTKDFLRGVADKIIESYNPKVVLDVGCAMGYLVEALRDKGVEAYGIDISDYAISKVRDDIKPYCKVGSILEPLPEDIPKYFDLIVTIEVIEHIYEEDCDKVIENMCKYTDNIILSSSPDDVEDITHVNVQQSEYWCKKFAKHNFYNKVDSSNNFITPWTIHFYKSNNIARIIEDYERTVRVYKNENKKLKTEVEKLSEMVITINQNNSIDKEELLKTLKTKEDDKEELLKILKTKEDDKEELLEKLKIKENEIENILINLQTKNKYISEIESSRGWKILKRLKKIVGK